MTQYQRFELSRLDEEIADLEKKISVKHEQRRELVNRMGLNKCEHKNMGSRRDEKPWNGPVGTETIYICADCGLPCQHMELKP